MTGVEGGEEGRDKEGTGDGVGSPDEGIALAMGTSVVTVGSGSEGVWDDAEEEEKERETESWIRGTDKTGENTLFMLTKIE